MNQRTKAVADVPSDPVDRRRNLRLALVLASVAATFLVGFVVKIVLLGKA
jgi:hypothetical protein